MLGILCLIILTSLLTMNYFSFELIFFLSMLILMKLMSMTPLMIMNNYLINMDYCSIFFMILTVVVFLISFISIMNMNLMNYPFKILLILMLLLLLLFQEMSLIKFYSWYELSLIPMFIIIMSYGYQPERLSASIALMFYTITASLPMIIMILFMNKYNFMEYLSGVPLNNFYLSKFFLIKISLILSFLIKLPMYPFHLWLPKAHVEAPVYGSMILAAIMLKMGSYGIIRFSGLFNMMNSLILILLSINIIAVIIISVICLTEIDMKIIIAYSSVAHMGVMLLSFLPTFNQSILSMVWVSISHGFSSSMMFLGAYLIYKRSHTRSLLMNKGSTSWDPSFTLMWFIAIVACVGAPLTINFMAEIISVVSIISLNNMFGFPLGLYMVISMGYSILLYSLVTHGKSTKLIEMVILSKSESLSLTIHGYYLILLIFMMNLMF